MLKAKQARIQNFHSGWFRGLSSLLNSRSLITGYKGVKIKSGKQITVSYIERGNPFGASSLVEYFIKEWPVICYRKRQYSNVICIRFGRVITVIFYSQECTTVIYMAHYIFYLSDLRKRPAEMRLPTNLFTYRECSTASLYSIM